MILRLENFLNKKTADKIEKLLVSDNFPWFYKDTLTGLETKNNNQYFFNHNLYANGRISSAYWRIGEMLVNKIKKIKEYDFKDLNIFRVKCNMYTKQSKKLKSLNHVDIPNIKNLIAPYYVNTNNGGTIIHENKNKSYFIPSVKNNIVIFDGSYQHQAVFQTDTKVRLNININLV